MTLSELENKIKEAIKNGESKRLVSDLYQKYDDLYMQSGLGDRDIQERIDLYFMILEYLNKKDKKYEN